ncbi:MAG: DUF1631 family protein [Methylophaga sp.]|nr:DUF1631 family protein [Methylophaga sp.]
MATNNIVSFGSHRNSMPQSEAPQHPAITSCRKLLEKSLPECFVFLNSLDDSLFKLTEQSVNSHQKDEYFAVLRQFRIKQNETKKNFTQLVLDDYKHFWSSHSGDSNTQEDAVEASFELSLMQNDALEEQIALKQIASKAESLLGYQLEQMDRRFSHILNTDTPFENPLSLEHIVNNLKKVLSPITSNISILLVAYKQFEQHALPVLKTLYEDINNELIQQEVLPTLNHKKRKSSSKTSTSSPSVNSDNVPNSDEFGDSEEESVIFDELRQLLGQIKSRSPSSHASTNSVSLSSLSSASGGTPATLDNVMMALSNLQHQPVSSQASYDEQGELALPDLRHSLMTSLSQTQDDGTVTAPSLSRIDDDTMNVITLLFEFVLEDQAIPAPIRALLARLQLPMLKVAITDKTFFSKKNHSARLLLNNLARASTGWDHSNGTEDILFTQVESIVDSILTNFDTNLEIFSELNEQLNQFIQQQEKSSDFAEQRIAKATEGQEKLILAQQEVDGIINQLMVQYSPVPKAVVTLIEDSWRQVLQLRFLQKGKDSPEWKEVVSLMEELLWSVTPKSAPTERKKLLETIPKLLKSLRDYLGGASFNQHKITALFKGLQECHIKCLNGRELEKDELQQVDKQDVINDITNMNSDDLAPVPEKDKVLSDEKALDAAKQLKVGTWLEVKQDNDVQRVKFSWRSNLTGRCLFVTYQGLKAAELALAELANWFQQGQAIILDQVAEPLMDRALVSMKDTIEKQNSSEEKVTKET